MKRCRRFVLTLVAALALTLSLAGTASANHKVLDLTDDANCKGQLTAFMAQKGPSHSDEPGLANTSEEAGRTLTEEQAFILGKCTDGQ